MTAKVKRRLGRFALGVVAFAGFCACYVRMHPLVFNESFWEHAHCINATGVALEGYAFDHGGRYPSHTNGYGDALLLLENVWLPALTGPGYDAGVFERARRTGQIVPEKECGRVYVQGLSQTNNSGIALFFDKKPTPGDHCHFLRRIWAPSVREVWMIGGDEAIRETEWPAFARRQVELLVAAGMAREQAERYYTEQPAR